MSVGKEVSEKVLAILGSVSGLNSAVGVVDTILDGYSHIVPKAYEWDDLTDIDKMFLYIYLTNRSKSNGYIDELSSYQLDDTEKQKFIERVKSKFSIIEECAGFYECSYFMAIMFGRIPGPTPSNEDIGKYHKYVDNLAIKDMESVRKHISDVYSGLKALSEFFIDQGTTLSYMIDNLGFEKTLSLYAGYIVHGSCMDS